MDISLFLWIYKKINEYFDKIIDKIKINKNILEKFIKL